MNRTIDALPVGRAFSQRTKALAIIDAILCPEWEYRCYSFNSGWVPDSRWPRPGTGRAPSTLP